jgi:hypothetical protein
VAYLPTCNLLVRRAALRAVGGFTPGLRLGEDVDLLWRMQARGLRAFYLPLGSVRHAYRERLWPFLRRKADYARSEAWLRRAHPSHFAGSPHRAPDAALALAAAGVLAGATAAGVASGLALLVAESLRHGWRQRAAVRAWPLRKTLAALLRRMAAGVLVRCRALVRQHAALGLALAPVAGWRPGWAAWLAAIFLAAAGGEALARRPGLRTVEFVAGYALDALAYSAGRWTSRLASVRGRTPPHRSR